MDLPFRPVRRLDGYLPIEDHGLIGDGATAALVGRDGAVSWMCLPRFDSAPLFCRILDAQKGGAFTLAPEGLVESRQYYEDDSSLLVTEMRTTQGAALRITDALTLRSGADLNEDVAAARCELVRFVEVLNGDVRLIAEFSPYGGARAERAADGLCIRCLSRPELDLHLRAAGADLRDLKTEIELHSGQRLHFMLRWGPYSPRAVRDPERILKDTAGCWRRWAGFLEYDGPQPGMVRRSAITLKLLDYLANGSLVAAPTSSLPENIGGVRNWDYRFAWVRDCAFSVYAFHRIGLYRDARAFLGWVLDAVERGERPAVLYNIDGHSPDHEVEDHHLEGYRRSRPVRWGNGAVHQVQNDVYGEIVDCAYQWAGRHGSIERPLWDELRKLVEEAGRVWRMPDRGIWEVRAASRPFTYSVALCWVALDRGIRLAERYDLPGNREAWRREAESIRQTVLDEAWNPDLKALTQHLGGTVLDASVLALPLRRLLPASDPRMVATTRAVREHLSAGHGLLYRYRQEDSPDGLPGGEGAFLMCSFWLVENLARQGRLQEASDLFDSLCARANSAGLLPEQIDPSTGAFLGNFPQAFSHVGLISSSVNLARELKRAREGA